MNIITPEEFKINSKLEDNKSVFLGGTIDNGDSLNWQDKTITELINLGISNINIYNPRREHWLSKDQHQENEYQIKWEQEHLDKSDLIVIVLLDDSKSPISLLEMGLYAESKKLIVFCTPNFYRWDNVRLTCEKYHIPLIQDNDPKTIAIKIINTIYTPYNIKYEIMLP